MYPELNLFGAKIYMFHICILCAFITAVLLFVKRTKNVFRPEVQDSMIALMGADIPFIMIGAIVHNKISYASSPSDFFDILFADTGIAYLGGFLGGLIGFMILFPILVGKQVSRIEVMNELVPSILIGHAIGRLGCLLGGCCYGKPSAFGIVYKVGTPAYMAYGAEKIFPVPILETILLFMLLGIILAIRKRAASLYLAGYSFIRFFLEFIRGDFRGGHGYLSPAQKICIGIFIMTICVNGMVRYQRN